MMTFLLAWSMNCAGTVDPPAPRSDLEDTATRLDGAPPSAVTVVDGVAVFFLSPLVVGVGSSTTEAVGGDGPGMRRPGSVERRGGEGVYVPETELLPVLTSNPVTFTKLLGPPCCPKGKTTCPDLISSTEGELT